MKQNKASVSFYVPVACIYIYHLAVFDSKQTGRKKNTNKSLERETLFFSLKFKQISVLFLLLILSTIRRLR